MTQQSTPLGFDLDEPRCRQRRILRFIPDWIFEELTSQSGLFDANGYRDAAIAELAIRQAADELLVAVTASGDILDRFEAMELSLAKKAVLARATNQSSDFTSGKLRELTEAAYETATTAYVGDMRSEPASPLINALVPLLVLADLYADDNYRDPRLVSELSVY